MGKNVCMIFPFRKLRHIIKILFNILYIYLVFKINLERTVGVNLVGNKGFGPAKKCIGKHKVSLTTSLHQQVRNVKSHRMHTCNLLSKIH